MLSILKEKGLLGDAAWALLGQFGSAIALLLGTRIITELVTPDIYGQVALLNGFVALGVAIFSYPFVCAGMRILPECLNKRERADLYRVVAGLTARSTLLAIGLLVLGGGVYGYLSNTAIWPFLLAALLLAATVHRELGIQLLIGERRQRDASLWQASDSVLRPLLAIALVGLAGARVEWVLLGYGLASIASNTFWSLFHGVKADEGKRQGIIVSRDLRREVWAYALPLIPMELVFWVNGVGDRYFIGYLMTAADVGLYAATYTLVNEAFNRGAMVLLRTFQPVYFQSFSVPPRQDGHKILWTWIAFVAALGIAGVSALALAKDWLASLLLAQSYHPAAVLMPAIGMGCALHALGTVLAQPLLANKDTRSLFLGRLSGAVAAAICIPLMVSHYGLPGAALANPIYFGFEALVLAMLAKPWRFAAAGDAAVLGQPEEEACGIGG